MLKNTLFIFFLSITINSFSQQIVVTPIGLRNAVDTIKKFVIIDAGDLSAKKLYDKALKFVEGNFPDPNRKVRNRWDSVDLIFDTYVPEFLLYNSTGVKFPIEAFYTTELRFYQGTVRYEIISLDMEGEYNDRKLLIKGNSRTSYVVYKNNGKLFKPDTKKDIENYFNQEIMKISALLNQQ